jgi:hypothetical protein
MGSHTDAFVCCRLHKDKTMTRAKKYTVDLKMFKGNEPIPCLIAT